LRGSIENLEDAGVIRPQCGHQEYKKKGKKNEKRSCEEGRGLKI